MRRNYRIYKNGGYWTSELINDNPCGECYQHESAATKEEVVDELLRTYPDDEIMINGVPANDLEPAILDKKAFREIILSNNGQFGKTVEIGDIKFNEGRIYPKGGNSYEYLGEDADKKTVDYLWRKARKEGMITYDNNNYYIQ